MREKGCDVSRSGANLTSRHWIARAAAALAVAGGLMAMAANLPAASAGQPAVHKRQVVKVVTRHPFGKMLSAKHDGLSLYYLPSGTCRGECLTVWPPLVLPKGSAAKPTGARCLSTAAFAHLRQVTYRGHRLYKFEDDSGTSVNGNGLSGFKVVKISKAACPKAPSA